MALVLSAGWTESEGLPELAAPGLWFEPSPAGFVARWAGRKAWLSGSKLVMALPQGTEPGGSVSFQMELLGARAGAELEGVKRLSGRVSYVRGRDRSLWRTGIPTFARLECEEVYPGIDLIYYSAERGLEYDFVVAPGADPSVILFHLSGPLPLERTAEGDFLVATEAAALRIRKPIVYQETPGGRRWIEGEYELQHDGRVRFALGEFDERLPLVIDPVVEYSHVLGGSGADRIHDVAVDTEGNTILIGSTTSADFPSESPLSPGLAGPSDAFIAKLDPSGSLLYATYLGGSGEETGLAVSAEGGRIYATGLTTSADFPTLSPLQPERKGEADAFLAVLDDFGLPVYATYLGGSSFDVGNDIAAIEGRAYVSGTTASEDFPLEEAFQDRLRGSADAFVAVVSPNGEVLERSTYLGGSGFDQGLALAVDREERVYLAGETSSRDFPVARPLQKRLGGDRDAFVAILGARGRLLFSTYFGGRAADRALGIALDPRGRIYLTGSTESTDFPVHRASQPSPGGRGDAFVASMTRSGSRLRYSTYLGGSGSDAGWAIATDATGVRVSGETASPDFPHPAAFSLRFSGRIDAFLVRLNRGGAVVASLLHGGSGTDVGLGVDLYDPRHLVLAGWTDSREGASGGPSDAFAARVDVTAADLALKTTDADHDDSVRALSVLNRGPDPAEEITLMLLLPEGVTLASARASQGTCHPQERAILCALERLGAGERATIEVLLEPPAASGGSILGTVTAATWDPNPVNNTKKVKGRHVGNR